MKTLEWIRTLNECRQKGIKILSIPELMNLSGQRAQTVRRTLMRLKQNAVLSPIYPGFWGYGNDITLEDLFLKIDPNSYISLETVLGRANILSSMTPDLTCVSLTQSRILKTKIGTLVFHKIKRDLFFGFDEARIATPEKALLDYLYLKTKSGSSFDWNKINLSEISQRNLKNLLHRFPNFMKKIVSIRIQQSVIRNR